MNNKMKRLFQLALAALMVILVGCAPSTNNIPETSVSPTEEFSKKNSFGDGYIAHIPINDVEEASQVEIVNILVTQWLEHYKTDSTQSDVMLKDYEIDDITIMSEAKDKSPFITALVQISIIPVQTQNRWLGALINIDEPWWHLEVLFGVYGKGEESQYYWLRIMSSAG